MKINSKQKSALLVMLLSLLIPNIMAQEPKMPTLEDLIPGGATYRSAENISGLQWCTKHIGRIIVISNLRITNLGGIVLNAP